MKYPKSPMLFECFDPDCGAALIIAVAEALSAGLNEDQMNVLGTFLVAVADTISYMAAQISYNKDVCAPSEDSAEDNKDKKVRDSDEDSNGSDNNNDSKNGRGIKRTVNKKADSIGHDYEH